MDDFTNAESAANFLLLQTQLSPSIALVLGSGLGGFADELSEATRIPYANIPYFPRSTAIGHAGHMVLTNAAGGINLEYKQGALVVITDHINLQGQNPLIGPNDDRFGPRFPDMTQAYSKPYREIALRAAVHLGKTVYQGVYAGLLGPSYETPAEIRSLRTMGADLVGMSTIPEVIAARHMGIKVLAISCVTNMAAGISDDVLSHEDVLATGERVKGDFVALLRAVLPEIVADVNT
jgi:purine-nucleoside phosphorylase